MRLRTPGITGTQIPLNCNSTRQSQSIVLLIQVNSCNTIKNIKKRARQNKETFSGRRWHLRYAQNLSGIKNRQQKTRNNVDRTRVATMGINEGTNEGLGN